MKGVHLRVPAMGPCQTQDSGPVMTFIKNWPMEHARSSCTVAKQVFDVFCHLSVAPGPLRWTLERCSFSLLDKME